jgi:flavin reductase (DIM6/NTAB) family NADH-FMN oxidoreductase RutF
VAFRPEHTGAPVLDEALAWLDCRVAERCTGGDHTVFVGEVVAADACEGTPLLYYRGGYGRFAP